MTRIMTIALIASVLTACSSGAKREDPSVKIFGVPEFPDQIRISVNNPLDKPICIPASEIESDFNNIIVTQDGRQLFSASNTDRALRFYKSINALDPIYIALSGKTDFWYDLNEFPLKEGPFAVRANIKLVDCSDLFTASDPKWLAARGQATLNYDSGLPGLR